MDNPNPTQVQEHQKQIEYMKHQIERFSKPNQIEVLKLIRKHSGVRINENKSGVYINLTFLEPSAMEVLQKYMDYVREQESILTPLECQKEDFKTNYFIENDKPPREDVITVYK